MKTILIVEDDIFSAMAIRDGLEDAGYFVLDLTGRPHDAVRVATARKPRLALVNIDLHGKPDGIGLAHALKTMDVPSLFISGQTSRARSASSAAIGSLPKPYTPADVVHAVTYLLSNRTTPPPRGLEVFATT